MQLFAKFKKILRRRFRATLNFRKFKCKAFQDWPPLVEGNRLFKVPIFPCDHRCRCGPLNASETGVSIKCQWVGVVEGAAGGKNRDTVTASLCLMFKGRGRNLAPPLIKSINSLFPGEKACLISERCSQNRFNAVTKLS